MNRPLEFSLSRINVWFYRFLYRFMLKIMTSLTPTGITKYDWNNDEFFATEYIMYRNFSLSFVSMSSYDFRSVKTHLIKIPLKICR